LGTFPDKYTRFNYTREKNDDYANRDAIRMSRDHSVKKPAGNKTERGENEQVTEDTSSERQQKCPNNSSSSHDDSVTGPKIDGVSRITGQPACVEHS